MNQFKSTFRAFIIALLATALMAVVRRFVIIPIFDFSAPAMPFILAVILAAWIGGWKSGLFATALNAVLLGVALDEEKGLELFSASRQLRLIMFVAIGGLISWGIGVLHASRQRLEDRQRELEKEMRRREQEEIELREREERTRLAVESAEIGTWDFNPLTAESIASARCKAAFGFSPEAEPGLADYIERIHPEDRDLMQHAMQSALDPTGTGTYDLDYRAICPDGTTRWLIAKGQTLFDGEMPNRRAVRFIGTVLDITDRKQAEDALRRAHDALEAEQEMLRHTIEVQDQERQLVAYEIHDGLVQYATGALMKVESLRDQVKSEALVEQIENVVGILRKTVDEGRRIINGIHTTILDDCGVMAAVQQLIEDEERAHVKVEFANDESLGRMAPNIELALYHITREALTNANKHSRSNRMRIELSRREDRVHLEVRDWGVGFKPHPNSKVIHGIKGMTERARIVGGTCTIENAPGKGTRVVVDLPYVSSN